MDGFAFKILCVGHDQGLLQSRCAVLRQAGCDASTLGPAEAELLLNMHQLDLFSSAEGFDLVILSSSLTENQRVRIIAAAGRTPILNLTTLTFAPDLLRMVKDRLGQNYRRSA
jgi:hypothetical protein